MDHKKRNFALSVFIMVAIAFFIYPMYRKANSSTDPTAPGSSAMQQADRSFQPSEKSDLLENVVNTVGNIEIFDSAFANKDSLIYLAAACKDLNTGLESGVAYATELGIGYILLASDVHDFVYLAEEGISLSPTNIISLSFLNTSTNEIHDYEIEFSKANENLTFTIHSSVREKA